MDRLSLKGPFPPRKASAVLRERLVSHLLSAAPAVGEPFFSDAELVGMSGLSRKTVRKALDEMHREGWIERRAGKGSFVGPRTAHPPVAPAPRAGGGRRTARLAVLAYGLSGSTPDWYSQGVLSGIDEAAVHEGVSIELLGSHTADVKVLARRLEQSRPDALVVMPSTTRHAFAIAEAQRMGIPCLLTSTRMLDLGLPTVCEDGAQGACLAVHHLVAKGHRRIGLLQRPDSAPWVFARRDGYVRGLAECGIELDERLVLWLSNDIGPENDRRLQEYLSKQQPSALLLGGGLHGRTVGHLVQRGLLRIPDELSLVSFDQVYAEHQINLGMRPTVVELPLREMGRQLARMARQILENQPISTPAFLPCELVEGESVKSLNSHLPPRVGHS